jgi:hypothetical protein
MSSPIQQRWCPNHLHVPANSTGLCPGCCARARKAPEDYERDRMLRQARTRIRLSLDAAARKAKNRKRHLRRKAKARAVAS